MHLREKSKYEQDNSFKIFTMNRTKIAIVVFAVCCFNFYVGQFYLPSVDVMPSNDIENSNTAVASTSPSRVKEPLPSELPSILFDIPQVVIKPVITPILSELPLEPTQVNLIKANESHSLSKPEFYVVFFYDDSRADKAQRMITTLEAHGIAYIGTHLKYNWFDHKIRTGHTLLSHKPQFIKDRLHRTNAAVLYVDGDLVFHSFPSIFTSQQSVDFDMMCVNWNVDRGKGDRSLLTSSGLFYFNNTDFALQLLEEWKKGLFYRNNLFCPDDQVLDRVWNVRGWKEFLNVQWLPLNKYLAMANWNHKTDDTIIEHPDPFNAKTNNFPPEILQIPRWVLQSGQVILNRWLVSGYCGSFSRTPQPILFERTEDFNILRVIEPCDNFEIIVESPYPAYMYGIHIQFDFVGAPGEGMVIHDKNLTWVDKGLFRDRQGFPSSHDMPCLKGVVHINGASWCGQHCDGYRYFGLQNEHQCWCGDRYGNLGPAELEQEVMCPDNITGPFCGGEDVNHVFEIVRHQSQRPVTEEQLSIPVNHTARTFQLQFSFNIPVIIAQFAIEYKTDEPWMTGPNEDTQVWGYHVKLSGSLFVHLVGWPMVPVPSEKLTWMERIKVMDWMSREGSFEQVVIQYTQEFPWEASGEIEYTPNEMYLTLTRRERTN